jgi:hypothetical protein
MNHPESGADAADNEIVFATINVAVHPPQGRSKHARVNLPMRQAKNLGERDAHRLLRDLFRQAGGEDN